MPRRRTISMTRRPPSRSLLGHSFSPGLVHVVRRSSVAAPHSFRAHKRQLNRRSLCEMPHYPVGPVRSSRMLSDVHGPSTAKRKIVVALTGLAIGRDVCARAHRVLWVRAVPGAGSDLRACGLSDDGPVAVQGGRAGEPSGEGAATWSFRARLQGFATGCWAVNACGHAIPPPHASCKRSPIARFGERWHLRCNLADEHHAICVTLVRSFTRDRSACVRLRRREPTELVRQSTRSYGYMREIGWRRRCCPLSLLDPGCGADPAFAG